MVVTDLLLDRLVNFKHKGQLVEPILAIPSLAIVPNQPR
jgi:hypothetical protein